MNTAVIVTYFVECIDSDVLEFDHCVNTNIAILLSVTFLCMNTDTNIAA